MDVLMRQYEVDGSTALKKTCEAASSALSFICNQLYISYIIIIIISDIALLVILKMSRVCPPK